MNEAFWRRERQTANDKLEALGVESHYSVNLRLKDEIARLREENAHLAQAGVDLANDVHAERDAVIARLQAAVCAEMDWHRGEAQMWAEMNRNGSHTVTFNKHRARIALLEAAIADPR